jgi:hypothetical protein
MKTAVVVLATVCVFGCASSRSAAPADTAPHDKIVLPNITFIQLVGPADLNFPSGLIQVQYGMRVENRDNDAITLRSIELTPVGTTGPYVLKRDTFFFGKKIPAATFGDVIWWANAIARGNPFALDAEAPVSVRATVFFETPHGTFRKVLFRDFSQMGTGARRGN